MRFVCNIKKPGEGTFFFVTTAGTFSNMLNILIQCNFLGKRVTCFTVTPRKSRFTITVVTSWEVDTDSSVLAWGISAFVDIYEEHARENMHLVCL